MKKLYALTGVSIIALSSAGIASAGDLEAVQGEIEALKNKLQQLEQQLKEKEPTSEEMSSEEVSSPATSQEMIKGLKLSGRLELDYLYKDFDEINKSKGGKSNFSLLRIALDGQHDALSFSAGYNWHSYMDVIHHAWVGYDFSDTTQLQLGVTQVPFGFLPYFSNNWWYGTGFYVGFEDNYDMGLKLIYDDAPFNVQLAFFKNEEWNNSSKLERYSYDILTKDEQANEKTNQLNARATYTIDHGDLGHTTLGVSGQYAQLYNTITDEMGDHWAAGVHWEGQYQDLNLKLLALKYEYSPENPVDVSRKTIMMGGLGDTYLIAAEASVLIANVGYEIPVSWGPIKSLYFYNDYSILLKAEDEFEDSPMNITGVFIKAGPVGTFIEYITAKNTPYVGAPLDSLAMGDPNAEWDKMLNILVGYNF